MMIKRLCYWLAKRSHHGSLIYWQKEIKIAQERLEFCKKALSYYEGGSYE